MVNVSGVVVVVLLEFFLLDANMLNYLLENNVIDDIGCAVVCYGAIKVHLTGIRLRIAKSNFPSHFPKIVTTRLIKSTG